jgi:hypothetical protein
MGLSKNITYIHAPMSQKFLYLSLDRITKAYAGFNIFNIIMDVKCLTSLSL